MGGQAEDGYYAICPTNKQNQGGFAEKKIRFLAQLQRKEHCGAKEYQLYFHETGKLFVEHVFSVLDPIGEEECYVKSQRSSDEY